MNKQWVEQKNKERDNERELLYADIRKQLSQNPQTKNDVEAFVLQIKKAIGNGFTTARYMIPPVVIAKIKNNFGDNVQGFRDACDILLEFVSRLPLNRLYAIEHSYYESYQDSDPMYFDGDIIITDPCYVASYSDWADSDDENNYLSAIGLTTAMMRSTIYGDWSCTTYNTDTKEQLGKFCADAGLVAVMQLDEVLKSNPNFDYHIARPWTTTLIRDFKGTVQFIVTEHSWTVDRDTPYAKKGDVVNDYEVSVVGHGINKKTGTPINFYTKQTGL